MSQHGMGKRIAAPPCWKGPLTASLFLQLAAMPRASAAVFKSQSHVAASPMHGRTRVVCTATRAASPMLRCLNGHAKGEAVELHTQPDPSAGPQAQRAREVLPERDSHRSKEHAIA
eukprot:CAMPEP_0168438056 /NCGR_PEP_ID=MMETSP0228-20121227/41764_1 /TAXON_ID=133427 /ORGANISM="Protoceratium reticulatum, Strain CCCM 535 (=CCMP 1889)" /LENGTH=115 /DNA_ID=CAMNT_0008452311 /DNA_START=23 /DNA_END=371 /DNA_ORIENTATION=+